ncbi:Hypothetical_protein [Hexamita inflata]|uniref:Hypothetical_protein n=1 Tax=Hexamita inflata TaxID=28002 RepID=A0AA86RBQ8_9EUKA|nr:Hypothetical protein HINF_LOCUS62150 [Hexamita inflata]
MLKITRKKNVRRLEFVENFDNSQLFIYDCKNMVSTLNNKQISYFHVQDCDLKSIEGLQLENLVVQGFVYFSNIRTLRRPHVQKSKQNPHPTRYQNICEMEIYQNSQKLNKIKNFTIKIKNYKPNVKMKFLNSKNDIDYEYTRQRYRPITYIFEIRSIITL